MSLAVAIFLTLCLFIVSKEFRDLSTGGFPWLHNVGLIYWFQDMFSVCWKLTERVEMCLRDRARAGLPGYGVCWTCTLGDSWRRKMPAASYFYWVRLGFVFPHCKRTKQILVQGWSVLLISQTNGNKFGNHNPAHLHQQKYVNRYVFLNLKR